jgi:catechol 2,3-dioxygenase-like lactoylglutathione lyase family enzyme
MVPYHIRGVQQVGLGVRSINDAWQWYNRHWGFDCSMFDDTATAPLMLLYTGGTEQTRRAKLAMNMAGGGGLEIWQYTSKPFAQDVLLTPDTTGIIAIKIRSYDVEKTFQYWRENNLGLYTQIFTRPDGRQAFRGFDPNGICIEFVSWSDRFMKKIGKGHTGGVAGALLLVHEMERACILFQDVLMLEPTFSADQTEIHWPSGVFEGNVANRMVLRSTSDRGGPYGSLLGHIELELISFKASGSEPIYDFEKRYWGDPGIIHICFDVQNMDALLANCEVNGFKTTVDSTGGFAMEKASGRFAYIEGPDRILIEFVESHKIPIVKSLGWYMQVYGREKSLPKWMLRLMALNRKRLD